MSNSRNTEPNREKVKRKGTIVVPGRIRNTGILLKDNRTEIRIERRNDLKISIINISSDNIRLFIREGLATTSHLYITFG